MADDQVFCDGLGAISVINGTVRLDFVALSPTEKDATGKPAAVFRQRIIMGLDGFLQAGEKIGEVMPLLAKRTPPAEAAKPAGLESRGPVLEPAGIAPSHAKPPFP